MEFESPEAIREIILAEVSLDILQPQSQNEQGELYRAYIQVIGASGPDELELFGLFYLMKMLPDLSQQYRID